MMTDNEATKAIWDLLGHAIEGRGEQAAQLLMAIGQDSDTARMYGVCCGIAEVGREILRKLYPAMAWAPSGYMWAMQQIRPGEGDPADVWAARFLVAWANKDTANTDALYRAAVAGSDDEYVGSICALVTTVAGLAITARTEKDGGAR